MYLYPAGVVWVIGKLKHVLISCRCSLGYR